MTTEEIKQKLRDNFSNNEFKNLIQGYGDNIEFLEKTGIRITPDIDSYRSEGSGDYDGWDYVFGLDDKTYLVSGYYDSNNGVELYDPFDFEEVKKMTKMEEYWGVV